MPVFEDSSLSEHARDVKQSLKGPDHKDSHGEGCSHPFGCPRLPYVPVTSNLGHGYDWGGKGSLLDGYDVMHEAVAYDLVLGDSYEGRRCDTCYTEFDNDFLDDLFSSGSGDPMLSELQPEPIAPTSCSFFQELNTNDEIGKVQQEYRKCNRSSGDEKEHTVSFYYRQLKNTKGDLELQYLGEVSTLPQIVQHADQTQYIFTSRSRGFGQGLSAGPNFGHQGSPRADDLNSDHGFGRPASAPLASNSKSLHLKHEHTDNVVLDEAVEIDVFAGPPERALQKMVEHADQARGPFMQDLSEFV